jgi:hypothetical protein
MEATYYIYGTNYGVPFIDGKKSIGKFTMLKNGLWLQDFFHIDDLLDFSNEEIVGPIANYGNTWPTCNTTISIVAADFSTINLSEIVT